MKADVRSLKSVHRSSKGAETYILSIQRDENRKSSTVIRETTKHLTGPPWRDIKNSFTFRYYLSDIGHWLLILLKSGLGQGLT
jgi:hypothetical protein